MSYVNLPPEATFQKLESVMRNQRRLMFLNVTAATLFASSLLASLMSLM